MLESVRQMLALQGGVIARRQALVAGLDDDDLERLLRRREWARVHPGVYLTHTGLPTWDEKAWAAVLLHWPAALAGPSALRAHGVRSAAAPAGAGESIHVVVDHARRLVAPPGVVLTRRVDFAERVQLHLAPPRLRIDEALLDVASACAGEAGGGRRPRGRLPGGSHHGKPSPSDPADTRTTAPPADVAHRARRRGGRHALRLRAPRYVNRVERPHGLPRSRRQVRVVHPGGVTYRDVEYTDFATVVELDGRLVHAGHRQRHRDLDRDIEATIRGEAAARLGWLHVLEPCRTAGLVGRLLQSRGWTGAPVPCGPSCGLG